MSDDRFEGSDDAAASAAVPPPTGPPLAGFSTPPPPPAPTPPPLTPTPPASTSATPVSAALPPPPPPIPVPTFRWRSLKGLTSALTVLLVLVAVASAFAIVAYFRRISALGDIIDGSLDLDTVRRVHDADDFVRAATGIMSLLSFAILVLIIIWTYRAAKNNEALGRKYPRLKPGWAIAGWLIPLANAVIPLLILQDLWRGSDATTRRDSTSWRANSGSALIGWYWAFLLVSVARNGFGRTRARLIVTDELRELRTHDTIAIVGLVAAIAAAVLAIQVVRRIAARQDECLRTQQADWYGAG